MSESAATQHSTTPAIARAGHPILAAWFDRLPWSVEAAPRKSFQLRLRLPRERAVGFDEIDPNPAGYVTSVVVDVDHVGAGAAWLDAGLPQPTLTIRSASGHAHLVWCLARWVPRNHGSAMRLLDAVQAAFTIVCDGDRAYSGPMHHNPLSPAYSTIVGDRDDFSLSELAGFVGERLFTPIVRTASGFRDDFAAAGRNCHAFETVRLQAYRAVAEFKQTSRLELWLERVAELVTTANIENSEPLPASEVRSISKSIATWTWSVYKHGSTAAKARRARYERSRHQYLSEVDEKRQTALKRRAEGASLTAIATELGVCRRTICNYVAAARPTNLPSAKSATIRTCAYVREARRSRCYGALVFPDAFFGLERVANHHHDGRAPP